MMTEITLESWQSFIISPFSPGMMLKRAHNTVRYARIIKHTTIPYPVLKKKKQCESSQQGKGVDTAYTHTQNGFNVHTHHRIPPSFLQNRNVINRQIKRELQR